MMAFTILFHYSLCWIRREWGRALFTVFGVALGTAVFVATLVAQTSMDESFQTAVEGFSGAGWWEIRAKESSLKADVTFPETIVSELYRENAGWPIVPELSVSTSLECKTTDSSAKSQSVDKRKVQWRGVDALALPLYYRQQKDSNWSLTQLTTLLENPEAIAIDGTLKLCVSLLMGDDKLETIATLQSSSDTELPLVMGDISWLQERVSLIGRLSRVLVKPSGRSEHQLLETLATRHGLVATPLSERVNRFRDITQAFRVNILFLSACSLIVAAYLLHSLLSFWCLRRRDDGRLLRSIGVTPRQLYWMVVIEALVIALAGTILGLVIGWLVGGVLLGAVTETVSILYTRVPLGIPTLRMTSLVPVVMVGVLLGFVSSHSQARDLAVSVVQAMRGVPTSSQARQHLGRSIIFALFFLALAWFGSSIVLQQTSHKPWSALWVGLGVPISYLIAILLLINPFVAAVLAVVGRAQARLSPSALLAIEHLNSAYSRMVGAVSALTLSAGLFVGINCMIVSFSDSLEAWLQQILRADIYVSLRDDSREGETSISTEAIEAVRALPGVRALDTLRTVHVSLNGRPYQLSGVSFAIAQQENRLVFLDGGFPVNHRRDVFVSEPFARWHGVVVGQAMDLPLADHKVSVVVRGIFKDYSTEFGVVLAQDELVSGLPGEPKPHGMSIYLSPSIAVQEVMAQVRTNMQGADVNIRSQRGLRDEVFRIFKSTFKVTHLLMWVTFFASVFVVVNSIILMVTERRDELDGIRALGASRNVICRMLAFEAAFLSMVGCLGALMCGLGLSEILVRFVNPFFFGWTLTVQYFSLVPFVLLLGIPPLMWLVGFALARWLFRTPARGIRYE